MGGSAEGEVLAELYWSDPSFNESELAKVLAQEAPGEDVRIVFVGDYLEHPGVQIAIASPFPRNWYWDPVECEHVAFPADATTLARSALRPFEYDVSRLTLFCDRVVYEAHAAERVSKLARAATRGAG